MPVYDAERTKMLNGYLGDRENPLTGSRRYTDEFAFITDYAQRTGGPILELACGAGRMMQALARLGYDVYGIDASRPMLDRGMQAKQQLSKEVQDRMHVIQGDMRSFKLNTVFSLIIIPFNSFWYNLDEKGAVECLRSIISHLAKSGFFLIDSPMWHGPLFFPFQSKQLKFDFTIHAYSENGGKYFVGWHSID